jgi:O-antigen/teichoic acid export membrane protein
MEEISRKMAKGAAWMIVARMSDRLIGLVSTVILARVLVPEDFGLIAMAMSIIAALELLGAFSFDLALIQNPNAKRRHYDTVWTFSAIFGATYAVMLVLLASPAAQFYNEPRLAAVMEWLALGTLVGGFTNVGVVAFRKEMQFDKEFKYILSRKLVSFIVTVTLALMWRDYWALVAGTLAGIVGAVLLSYMWQSYRPRFSLAARGELLRFSKWLFFNNLIFFFNTRLSDFVIGRMGGPHSLGLYSVSLDISNLPTSELAAPVNRAVFSGYSKMAGDLPSLRNGFLNVLSVIVLLVLPAGAGITVTADLLVPVVLGPNWMDTVILIQILAWYGVCMAVQTNTGIMFVAMGKPQVLTALAGGYLVVLFPSMAWLTLQYGAIGAALAVAGSALLFLPINYYVLLSSIELQLSRVLAVFWRPAAATAIMVCIVEVIEWQLMNAGEPLAPLLKLLLLIAAGVIAYVATLSSLWRLANCPDGPEQFIWDNVIRRLKVLGWKQ